MELARHQWRFVYSHAFIGVDPVLTQPAVTLEDCVDDGPPVFVEDALFSAPTHPAIPGKSRPPVDRPGIPCHFK